MFAIVAASAGEWLGGTATTGVSEYSFNHGLAGAWYTIGNGIGVMFLALCFAKLYRSLNTVTVPGIIEKFFGVNARTVSSILLTVAMLAVGLAQMIAAGKLGESIMNILGFDVPHIFVYTVVVFAIIFIVYTLAGGMNAVASTNKLHLFVMYGGVILALFFVLPKIGGIGQLVPQVKELQATDGKDYFNLFSGEKGVRGFAVSQILASLLGACTAQAGIQPILAAKNVSSAKKACIITACVAAPFGLLTGLLGIVAKVMSHNGDLLNGAGVNVVDGKLALFTLMQNVNPIIGGLVLSAILAAILSTVSPIILSSGTMITKDLYQRVLRPNATDKQVLKMSRITTAIAGVVCALGAIALVNASEVLTIVKAAYSLRGALFVVVLFGIYWKKASEKGACVSMILTAAVAVFWKGYYIATTVKDEFGKVVTDGHYPISNVIEDTYAAVAVALVATIVFSLVFPKKDNRRAA
jgi:SSS family solute:Na+ symporter